MRNLGLVDVQNKNFTISDNVKDFAEEQIYQYLQNQIRRNRVVSLTLAELNDSGFITLEHVADLLKDLFPSVQAKDSTWEYYSKTTVQWLHEVHLAFYNKHDKKLYQVDDEAVFESVVSRGSLSLTGFRFPVCFKNAIIECVETIYYDVQKEVAKEDLMVQLGKSLMSVEKALSDCLKLGLILYIEQHNKYRLSPLGMRFVEADDSLRREIFKEQCMELDVFNQFVEIIEKAERTGITSKDAAQEIVLNLNLDLAELTVEKLGSMLANWAEYSGIVTRTGRICLMKQYVPEQMKLF